MQMEGLVRLRTVLDFGDRFILGAGCIMFWLRFAPQALAHPQYILLMLETGFIAAMAVFRPLGRPFAERLWPVFIAMLATNLLSWVRPDGFRPQGETIGAFLIATGFFISVMAKIALNRRFTIIPAVIDVQDRGPYALIRHPIYAGYFISHFGFLITNPTLWNFGLYATAMTCQILRIGEEEKILSTDPRYAEYRERVRFRLIPGVY